MWRVAVSPALGAVLLAVCAAVSLVSGAEIVTHEYAGGCSGAAGVSVTETVLPNAGLQHIDWVSDQVAFATTSHPHDVLRTTDAGKNWVDQSSRLPGFSTPVMGNHGVQHVYVSPAQPRVAYLMGFGGAVWTTTDSGATYSAWNVGKNVSFLLPHPTQPAWLIAHAHESACFRGTPGNCSHTAMVSQDYGATWRVLAPYIRRCSWADAGSSGVPEGTVWVLGHKTTTGPQRALAWTDLELWRSTDLMATRTAQLARVVDYLYYHGMHFAVVQKPTGGGQLLTMPEGAQASAMWDVARFPKAELLSEWVYVILHGDNSVDLHGGSFVAVVHNPRNFNDETNLYKSASMAENFTLAMPNVAFSQEYPNPIEFHRIAALDGLYLANQVFTTGGGSTTRDTPMGTFISRNGGTRWNPAPTPSNLCPSGNPACSDLQLHIDTADTETNYPDYGPLLTSDHAVGVVLANGNPGRELLYEPDNTGTYLSADAGWSWTRIAEHPYVYAFGDHGGLILMARPDIITRELTYTWSRGSHMAHCNLDNNFTSAMRVYGILGNPSKDAKSFLIHGRTNGTDTAVILHVDFSTMPRKQCTQADFEDFTPPGPDGPGTCLNGETATYRRLSAHANCSESGLEKPVRRSPCPCTDADFTCDFCHEPGRAPYSCVLSPSCAAISSTCIPGTTFINDTGYRKVTGNKCVGGVNKAGVPTVCPSRSPAGDSQGTLSNKAAGSAGVIVLIVVLVVLVFAAVGAFWHFKARPHPAGCAGAIGDLTSSFSTPGQSSAGGHRFEPLSAGGDDDIGTALDDDLLDAPRGGADDGDDDDDDGGAPAATATTASSQADDDLLI